MLRRQPWAWSIVLLSAAVARVGAAQAPCGHPYFVDAWGRKHPTPACVAPATAPPVSPTLPAPAEARQTGSGRLTVVCLPECVVAIDGKSVGRSPVLERVVASGTHHIIARWRGRRATALDVAVPADRSRTVRIAGPSEDDQEPVDVRDFVEESPY